MAPIGFKRRVRLPDALPDVEFAPPRGRSRRALFLGGLTAWSAAIALAWALLTGLWVPQGVHSVTAPRATPSIVRTAALPPRPPQHEPLPAATQSTGSVPPPPALPGCEEALEHYHGAASRSDWSLPRDMTETDYSTLLDGPKSRATLHHCRDGKAFRLDLCVAVLGIKAVGVSVRTEPEDAKAARCIRNVVAGLRFPHQSRPQLFRTRISL